MNIKFHNNCRDSIILSVESKTPVKIQPYDTIFITCEETDKLDISIKREITSQVEKHRFAGKKYILVLESKYSFINVNEGEVFEITREKISCSYLSIYYDRLFLTTEKAECFSESHTVSDSERIKKAFDKHKLELSKVDKELALFDIILEIMITKKTKMFWSQLLQNMS